MINYSSQHKKPLKWLKYHTFVGVVFTLAGMSSSEVGSVTLAVTTPLDSDGDKAELSQS